MKTVAMLVCSFSLLFAFAAPCGRFALAAEGDPKGAAREHFQKGLAAFADQRFAEAAEEFDAAYKLSPAFKLLYNIGLVDVALGRSVEAVDAFDRYLKQGASAIPADRRREVSDEIEKQLARIGTVSIRTFPEGAEIRIDGALIGRTPLSKPVRVNAGRHTVEAILAGYSTQTREIAISGKAENAIEMTLDAIPAPAPSGPAIPVEPALPMPAPAPSASPPVVEKVIIETPAAPSGVSEKTQVERESPSPQSAPTSSIGWQRIGGLVVIAAGLVTATVGGIDAYHGSNQAKDASNRLAHDTQQQYDADLPDFNAGQSLNQRGWIIAGVGAAVFVGGIVLVATAPKESNIVSLAPWVTAEAGGVVVGGAW
jgi:tetratricopeptide (TPR) repeat protein